MAVVDLFADIGQIAAEEHRLPEAMALFAARLDLAGHGQLLTEMTDLTCWAATHGPQVAGCRCEKAPPDPKPVTPPPPPPPKPGK